MTATEIDARQRARAPIPWGLAVAATALTAGTLLLIWFVAVPFGPVVCPAIYPAPRNCFAVDRAGTGLVVTVIVITVYVGTLLLALAGSRRRRPLVVCGVVLLAIAPLIAYLAVAWIPGFAIN